MMRSAMWLGVCGWLTAMMALGQNRISDVDDLVVPEGLQLQEFAVSPMIWKGSARR